MATERRGRGQTRLGLGLRRVNRARWRERDSGRPRTEREAAGYANEVGLRQTGESVESLGASDGSRKLTTQMSQWSSGIVRSPCCLTLSAEGDRKRRCGPELKWRIKRNISTLLDTDILSPLCSSLQSKWCYHRLRK